MRTGFLQSTVVAAMLVALAGSVPVVGQRMRPREGHLKPGDLAPDFSLDTHDRKQHITLSSFRGEKAVVLIFGSYT